MPVCPAVAAPDWTQSTRVGPGAGRRPVLHAGAARDSGGLSRGLLEEPPWSSPLNSTTLYKVLSKTCSLWYKFYS